MLCFLDTNAFGKLLTAVDHKKLPPDVLSESLLSPVTACELAEHTPKIRILRKHSSFLRPLTRLHSRVLADLDWAPDFVSALASNGPDYFRALLNVMHTRCVMYAPFLKFHQSRYGGNPPTGIAGSKQYTNDVRDSMQLLMSQEIPFITCDHKLAAKPSPMMNCKVIKSDLQPELIVMAMRIANAGMLTADKWR